MKQIIKERFMTFKNFISGILISSSLALSYYFFFKKHRNLESKVPKPSIQTALKWYRSSAEKNAIYHEIFYLAKNSIEKNIKDNDLKEHTWGVILDIDETILDGTCFFIHRAGDNCVFFKKQNAQATPGAIDFINTIQVMGGYINLVTNREIERQEDTKKALQQLGIRYDQILFRKKSEGCKNKRFQAVQNGEVPSILPKQAIVAWLGDNIEDIPQVHQKDFFIKDSNDSIYRNFGKKYFIFPNPIYGSWKNMPIKTCKELEQINTLSCIHR